MSAQIIIDEPFSDSDQHNFPDCGSTTTEMGDSMFLMTSTSYSPVNLVAMIAFLKIIFYSGVGGQ